MKEYRVTWEIDITADTPENAARQALAIQRDVNSRATNFNVRDEVGTNGVDIDMEQVNDN